MSRTIVFWVGPGSSTDTVIKKALASFDEKPKTRIQMFDGCTLYVPQPGELVLGFGSGVVELLRQKGVLAKKFKTVDSVRGKVHGDQYMLTYSPELTKVDEAKADEIGWDIRLAVRYVRTGTLKPKLGQYRWVSDFSELVSAINCTFEKTGKPVEVSADTETIGFHPYDGAPIVAYGFTDRPGFADCLYVNDIETEEHAKRVIEQTRWLLTSDRIKMRGANFKFDMMWFGERFQIDCTNFAFDTLLAGSMIDENRSNSLNWHTKMYVPELGGYDDEFNDKHDKGRMDLVPKDELLQYLGGDIDAVFRCAVKIKQELLAVPQLAHAYLNLKHPASQTFGKMERRGVLSDRKKFEELRIELEGVDGKGGFLADVNKKALALLPARIRMKYADDLSLGRDALLKDFFFSPLGLNLKPRMVTPKKGEPSTSKAHLSMFYDVPEAQQFVTLLAHRSSAEKTLSTYVKGFLKHLRSDGYFHPSYMLFAGKLFEQDKDDSGTNTGRTSAKDPAIQTVPKHWRDKTAPNWAKKIRLCFPAPPGKVIWSTDAIQGELKIAACLANEEAMLEAYRNGLDLHAVTGSAMLGMAYEEFMKLADDPNDKVAAEKFDLGRYKAKAANFGLLYAMMAAGFVRYAWANFKMILTQAQAQDIIDKFFAKYPALHPWHDAYKAMAHRDGYVSSPFGYVRHLPLIHSKDWKIQGKAERNAINSPVQNTLSELTCWALTEITGQIQQAEPCAMIHDAGLGYCNEEDIADVHKRVVEVASNLPVKEKFGWDHQIPFTFDFEAGPTMGSMTKMKLAA